MIRWYVAFEDERSPDFKVVKLYSSDEVVSYPRICVEEYGGRRGLSTNLYPSGSVACHRIIMRLKWSGG